MVLTSAEYGSQTSGTLPLMSDFVKKDDAVGLLQILEDRYITAGEVLDSRICTFGVTRHGKTENIDNEGDSQKSKNTGLSASEYIKETSYLYMSAKNIVDMGYTKYMPHFPGDTLRNRQSCDLKTQYILQLNPDMKILQAPTDDTEYQKMMELLHARKQFTADVYEGILSKSYISDSVKSTIRERQGKKHVSGDDRKIDVQLSEDSLAQLKVEDPELYTKLDGTYEESYATIVYRAGIGIDMFKKFVAAYNDPEVFHDLNAYRTTLQATDQVMKSNKDVKGTDNFFDIGFAQTNIAQVDNQGNSINALTMNSYAYDPKTYEYDIKMFHAIQPHISHENDIYENVSHINVFLSKIELYIKRCIGTDNQNKNIERNEDLLTRVMSKKMPPVMARRIIETVLNTYTLAEDKEGTTKKLIDTIISIYIEQNPGETGKLLELLGAYTKVNNAWKNLFGIFFEENKHSLLNNIGDNDNFMEFYKQLEYLENKKQEYTIHNKFGELDLQELRVERDLKDNCDEFLTQDDLRSEVVFNHKKVIDSSGITIEKISQYFNRGGDSVIGIGGLKGTGKSTLLKKLELDFLSQNINKENADIQVITCEPFLNVGNVNRDEFDSILPYIKGEKELPEDDRYIYYPIKGGQILRSLYLSKIRNYISQIKQRVKQIDGQLVILIDDAIEAGGYDLIAEATGWKFIYTKGLSYDLEDYNSTYMKMKLGNDGEKLFKTLPFKLNPKLYGIYENRINKIIDSGICKDLTAGNIEDFTDFLGSIDSWKIDTGMIRSEYVEFIINRLYHSSNPDENRNLFESGRFNQTRKNILNRIAFDKIIQDNNYNDCLIVATKYVLENKQDFNEVFDKFNISVEELQLFDEESIGKSNSLVDCCNHSDNVTLVVKKIAGPLLDSLCSFGFVGVEYDDKVRDNLIFSNSLWQNYHFNQLLYKNGYDIYTFFDRSNWLGPYKIDKLLDGLLFNNTKIEYEKTRDLLMDCLGKEGGVGNKDLLEKAISLFKTRLIESSYEIDMSGFSSI